MPLVNFMDQLNYGIEMPGFSTEQVTSMIKHMEQIRGLPLPLWPGQHPLVQQQYLQSTQQATQAVQQSTLPAPQAKKEEVKETRQKPLYQATVEDDDEEIAESPNHGNSMLTGSKTYDSKQLCGKWTPHTGLLATFLATSYLTSFGSFQASFFGTALLLASQFGYIRCMEKMEASGEG